MVCAQTVIQDPFCAMNVRCTVKWFNLQKGYGFLAPEDNSGDIFMHFSVLEQAGYYHVSPGYEVVCDTGMGKRGTQAIKIHEVMANTEGSDDLPQNLFPQSTFTLEEKTGFVKWFNILKGYGFIQPDDNGRDIFIHTAVLKRIGVDRLPPGQQVRVKVFSTERGREARDVHIDEEQTV